MQRAEKSGARDLEQPDAPDAASTGAPKQKQHDAQQKAQPNAQQEAKRQAAKPLAPVMIVPALSELPVYVREGTILPIAPLTQSTSEVPQGPLTLRVYPGETCQGELYQDDGKSFAFRQGQFFRQHVTCTQYPDGSLAVHLGVAEGSFTPWWKSVRIEAYGWTPVRKQATVATRTMALQHSASSWFVEIPVASGATEVLLQ